MCNHSLVCLLTILKYLNCEMTRLASCDYGSDQFRLARLLQYRYYTWDNKDKALFMMEDRFKFKSTPKFPHEFPLDRQPFLQVFGRCS